MSKRKNRLASDPFDPTPEQIREISAEYLRERAERAEPALPSAISLDAPAISLGAGETLPDVVVRDVEPIEPTPAQIEAFERFGQAPDVLPTPRWRLQIAEQVEALGLVVQSIEIDRGASVRAASCAITVYGDGRTSIVARGAAERADAAIAQALETLRWAVEPA